MTRSFTMTGALAHMIATGRKTLHLHPARHDQDFRYRRCPYLPGEPIPVLRNVGEDPVLHVEVTTSRIVTLAQLKPDEIAGLGHGSVLDHRVAWLQDHDQGAELADPDIIQARFVTRWAHRPVWLMTIRPTHAPRFMSARPPSNTSGQGDYTTDPRRAMREEGEAVPQAYQEVLSLQARNRDDERRRAAGQGRDLTRQERNRERYERRKAA